MHGLQPLRQRRPAGLPGDPGHGRPQRPPRVLLGAGQVGAGPAGRHHERPADLPEDRAGRRPPGPVGPLRRVEGRGVRLRLHPGRAGSHLGLSST